MRDITMLRRSYLAGSHIYVFRSPGPRSDAA